MDWLGRLNDALGYIEENLDGEIDIDGAGNNRGYGMAKSRRNQ